MNILMAASEAAPWIKTGGLGDVLESLPKALAEKSSDCLTLILPYYKSIKENPAYQTEEVCYFRIPLAWRNAYVGVMKLVQSNSSVVVYFIDNNDYFNREKPYGYFDDGERFAFFSKAVICAAIRLGLKPDVIHCHDWQTALIPLFLQASYRKQLPNTATMLTIHNLEYQGWCNPDFLHEVLSLGEEWRNTVEFNNCVNFLKTGIETADSVTTVSETYAQEILTPEVGGEMSSLLSMRRNKLSGIVNGINMDLYNPFTCKDISTPFSAEQYVEGKEKAKQALYRELNLPQTDKPLLAIVSRLAGHKGVEILLGSAERILSKQAATVVICGSGEEHYESAVRNLMNRYPESCYAFVGFNSGLANRIYAACDIYMMPSVSEPCGLSQLIAMRYGGVPVVHRVGGLRDTVAPYNFRDGTGRGFVYDRSNVDDFTAALQDAISLYGDQKKWKNLCVRNMTLDFSWKEPARKYHAIYERLVNEKKNSMFGWKI